MLLMWRQHSALVWLTLSLWTISCEAEAEYEVLQEYDLCNPDQGNFYPYTVYMKEPGISTQIYVNFISGKNETVSKECLIFFKTCSSCRIEVENVDEPFNYSNCSLDDGAVNDPTICLNNCVYISLYDNYYKTRNRKVSKSESVIGFKSDSSQLIVIACIKTFLTAGKRISIKLKLTSIEKVQDITVTSYESLPQRTFQSPNFSYPYVANSESYTYRIKSSRPSDYITVSFDDWILSPTSKFEIQGGNYQHVFGEDARPYIISQGPSLNITFFTGSQVIGGYYSYLGFQAVAKVYSVSDLTAPTFRTDCGEFISSSGGTVMIEPDPDISQRRDCIWVIKKMSGYDGVILRIIQYKPGSSPINMLEVRGGLTSDKPPLKLTYSDGYTSDIGYYIRLKGYYFSENSLQFTYAMYKNNDCTDLTNYFLCGNGYCIARTLKCDGFDHCGDRSDENTFVCNPNTGGGAGGSSSGGGSSYSISIGVIIPIVVSVFLVVVMCLLIVFIRRCRRLSNNTLSHPVGGGTICQQNRGHRPRHHNHVQMSLVLRSEENPPSYDEVIQNTPIGYLNMAFSWTQGDLGQAQPPSYEESVTPTANTAGSQIPATTVTTMVVGGNNNILMHSTTSLNTPQHQTSALTRATLLASLDPGAYVSSSSSSEDPSDHDSRLNTSSSSDSSTDNGLFQSGSEVRQKAQSNVDLSQVVSIAPKSRNSIAKPVAEGACVDMSTLSFTKEKTEVNRKLSKSLSSLHQVINDNAAGNSYQGAEIRKVGDSSMATAAYPESAQNNGREGMYVKKTHSKPSRYAKGLMKHQELTDSSRSQSCVDLYLGGAEGGQLPSATKYQLSDGDKRFSYAGYGDVSLRKGDFDPLTFGRGLKRDKPVEDLNKYMASSCDSLLDSYKDKTHKYEQNVISKETQSNSHHLAYQKNSLISDSKAPSLKNISDVTKDMRQPTAKSEFKEYIPGNPTEYGVYSLAKPRHPHTSLRKMANNTEIPSSNGELRHHSSSNRTSKGSNDAPSHHPASTHEQRPHYSQPGHHPASTNEHKLHYSQPGHNGKSSRDQNHHGDKIHKDHLASRQVTQSRNTGHAKTGQEPIYQTPRPISDVVKHMSNGQTNHPADRPVDRLREHIYDTPRQPTEQVRPIENRLTEYHTPQPSSDQAQAKNYHPNHSLSVHDPERINVQSQNIGFQARQKPVPAPRQGSKKKPNGSGNQPVPVSRSQRPGSSGESLQASGNMSAENCQMKPEKGADRTSLGREETFLTLDPAVFCSDKDVFV